MYECALSDTSCGKDTSLNGVFRGFGEPLASWAETTTEGRPEFDEAGIVLPSVAFGGVTVATFWPRLWILFSRI